MKVNAEQQFQPTQSSVKGILAAYDLLLVSFTPAQGGIENCTLLVTTSQNDYVLRIYRRNKKSDSEIIAELDFINYLDKRGVPVAPVIANAKGKYITNYDGWQSILMPKVRGIHATLYSPLLVKRLATTQVKIHQSALTYRTNRPVVQPLNFLQDTMFLPNVDLAKLNHEAQALLRRAASYTVSLPNTLPAGLCHLDYDIENILVDESEQIVAVLDFDDLTCAPFVVCLSYTLWDVMFQEDLSLVKDYLASYSVHRKLTGAELQLIPKIMLFRHYAIAALIAFDGGMDEETAKKYTRVENAILSWHAN